MLQSPTIMWILRLVYAPLTSVSVTDYSSLRPSCCSGCEAKQPLEGATQKSSSLSWSNCQTQKFCITSAFFRLPLISRSCLSCYTAPNDYRRYCAVVPYRKALRITVEMYVEYGQKAPSASNGDQLVAKKRVLRDEEIKRTSVGRKSGK